MPNKSLDSPFKPFNPVQRIWKPTPEYYSSPWKYYEDFIEICKFRNVNFITMSSALDGKYDPSQVNLLLDHHIDFYPVETHIMCKWEKDNAVISNIYIFNRCPYDDTLQIKQWTVEDLDIDFYKSLEKSGFEIGYHQNAVGIARGKELQRNYNIQDLSKELIAKAQKIFAEDVENLRRYFNIRTFIPHGAGEGNSQLLDLPTDYDDLKWVYNNAKRNGTQDPPLNWNNYSDSCGQSLQRIRGYRGCYITNRANLHIAAWMLKPGLNHVLVHPGRFAKGMPYETYDGPLADLDAVARSYEFSFEKESVKLPVRTSALQDNMRQNNKEYNNSSASVGCMLLFTDCIETIKECLLNYDRIVPIWVIHSQLDREERKKFLVQRPISKTFHLPELEGVSRDNYFAGSDEEFLDEFRFFFNHLYTDRIFHHISKSKIIFTGLVLKNLNNITIQEGHCMIKVLTKTHTASRLLITVNFSLQASEWVNWKAEFEEEWLKKNPEVSRYSKKYYMDNNKNVLLIRSIN